MFIDSGRFFVTDDSPPQTYSYNDFVRKAKQNKPFSEETKNPVANKSNPVKGKEPVNTRKPNRMKKRMKKVMGSVMREVNATMGLSSGRIALNSPSGLVTLTQNESGHYFPQVNPMNMFETSIPAYAMRTELKDIKVGNIYTSQDGKQDGFVVGINLDRGSIDVLNAEGIQQTVVLQGNTLLGGTGVFIVKNVFGDMLASNNNPMLGMFISSLFSGDDGDEEDAESRKEMIQVAMMSHMFGGNALGQGNAANANPLMGMVQNMMFSSFFKF